ncbi:MAG: rhamnan synthesis F family protein [Rickettsiales bacterium]|jgi:lipopolysaccharide biosynthesis protein|nr:rhamnan synthesis F family protein [Rickettsiales bacterium]
MPKGKNIRNANRAVEKNKRLFIFASYDKDCIVDDMLIHYVRSLAELGDVIFFADCDFSDAEIKRISKIKNVIHAAAERHGEYDFGSYKRGYQWAAKRGIFSNYDWVYLANDSVYGPLRPLRPILEGLESSGADAVGMISLHGNSAGERKRVVQRFGFLAENHVQSWFIGLGRQIFAADWFAKFLGNVKKQKDKMDVVWAYEFGMSHLIMSNGFRMEVYEKEISGLSVFGQGGKLLGRGMPFLKKLGVPYISRKELAKHIGEEWTRMIEAHAARAGAKFDNRFANNKRRMKYRKAKDKYGRLSLCTIFHRCLYRPYIVPFIPLYFTRDLLRMVFKGVIKKREAKE